MSYGDVVAALAAIRRQARRLNGRLRRGAARAPTAC